ncbi:hypothetical protein FACS189450_13100 [Spirochaetia bacterium]|nr:hypothetical protein FACS189450_13100 [Spirochaetia bacterium]
MALMLGYKPVEVGECSPITRDIETLLTAAGFVNEERGKDEHCGTFHDLEIVRAVYGKENGERVFLVTHLPETACVKCTFTHTCDHKVALV